MLICKSSDVTDLPSLVETLRNNHLSLAPYVQQVAKYAPLRKEQYQKYNSLWPLVFHDVYKAPVFSPEDVAQIEGFMRLAIHAARQSQHSGEVRGQPCGAGDADHVSSGVVTGVHLRFFQRFC